VGRDEQVALDLLPSPLGNCVSEGFSLSVLPQQGEGMLAHLANCPAISGAAVYALFRLGHRRSLQRLMSAGLGGADYASRLDALAADGARRDRAHFLMLPVAIGRSFDWGRRARRRAEKASSWFVRERLHR
jgi:hypothetical protein